ncbi:hypothetical protein, partial [Streptococcus pneumoniae]|uniref:hypothetical protein n=1 Tax=Streptococcus pneumoniae TaxID=1313 RepID=UPI001C92BE7E
DYKSSFPSHLFYRDLSLYSLEIKKQHTLSSFYRKPVNEGLVLSAISNQCFELNGTRFLVCSLILIGP